MRFMVLVKSDSATERGEHDEAMLTAMGHFNEELVKAGILLAGEGLHPSARGKRVRFADGKTTVVDGPFAETKELLAGFWILQARTIEEVVEWMRRSPFGRGGEAEIEIRQVYEAADFGPELTAETRVQEERLRAEIARQQS